MLRDRIVLADVLRIEYVDAAFRADERIGPAGDGAFTGHARAGNDARFRPALAFVLALRKGDVMVGLTFGGTLRPDGHE